MENIKYPYYSPSENVVFVKKNNNIFTFTLEDIEELYSVIRKEVYFKEDVRNFLDIAYESGDIDEEKYHNLDFFDDLLNEYYNLRLDNDGTTDGLNWEECLEEAFEKVINDYGRDI